MKEKLIIVFGVLAGVIILSALVLKNSFTFLCVDRALAFGDYVGYVNPPVSGQVDVQFTSRTDYEQKNQTITDTADIAILSQCLGGAVHIMDPACPIYEYEYLTFNSGGKSLTFHLASDGCTIARVGTEKVYVDIKNNDSLNAVLIKYGLDRYK